MRHSLSHSTCTCLSDSCWPRGNEHVDSYIQNPQSKWSWSLILIMIWSLFKMWSFKRSDQNQKKDLDLWSWSLKKWSYPSMLARYESEPTLNSWKQVPTPVWECNISPLKPSSAHSSLALLCPRPSVSNWITIAQTTFPEKVRHAWHPLIYTANEHARARGPAF